ncbi:tail protein, partial [Escherichia coli O157:H7 str. 2009EL2109]
AEIKTLHLVPREGMQVSEKPSVVSGLVTVMNSAAPQG